MQLTATHFWGVETWFTEQGRDSTPIDRRRGQDMPVVVEGLPLFEALTVHVKALYEAESGIFTSSETIDAPFIIGGGGGWSFRDR